MNHLYIGKGPYQEQLTPVTNKVQAKRERFAFINQLKRMAGIPPLGVTLQILPEEVMSVVCFYDNTPEAKKYALRVESLIPAFWDEEAKQALL